MSPLIWNKVFVEIIEKAKLRSSNSIRLMSIFKKQDGMKNQGFPHIKQRDLADILRKGPSVGQKERSHQKPLMLIPYLYFSIRDEQMCRGNTGH